MNPGSGSLRRGAAYVLLGNGVFNACRLVAAPVLLAKFTSAAVLGQYETGMALAAPFVLLCSLELRSVFVADTRGEFSLRTYEWVRAIGLVVAASVVLAIAACTTGLGDSAAMAVVLVGACGLRFAYQYAELYWGVYQRHERLDLLARSNALRGLIMLAAFGVAIPLAVTWSDGSGERGVEGAAVAVAVTFCGWLLVAWLQDRRWAQAHTPAAPPPRWSELVALARCALPLGIVAALISLCENAPRWVIRADSDGLRSLGKFAALAAIPMAAHFVVIQVALASSNRLALRYRDDPRAFLRLGLGLIAISLALGAAVFAAVWLAGPTGLRILYSPEYAVYFESFVVLVAGQCIILPASVLGYILTQMRWFWPQVVVHGIVLGGTMTAAWLLIPESPVRGGAWTMVVRACLQTVLYAGCFWIGVRRMPPTHARAAALDTPES